MSVPNIIYIHSHDTGRRISPYGFGAHTPALERFAERATTFTNAVSAAPTCSPSRAALLTGRYPHEVGMLGLAHRGFALSDYRGHIVAPLADLGYETVLCGIQHVAPEKTMIGYRRILDEKDDYFRRSTIDPREYDKKNTERVIAFLTERFAAEAREAGEPTVGAPPPFFLSFGLLQTHRPFPRAGTTPEEDYAAYREAATAMDASVDAVLEAIERTNAWEHTVVIYTTDHGIAFPDMKGTLRGDGVGVALIVWVPPALLGGTAPTTVEALVSQIDLFPTILELAGGEQPPAPGDEWSARSVIPLLQGRVDAIREYAFSEQTFHAAYEPVRAVRTKSHALIRRFGGYRRRVAANIDDSASKEAVAEQGFFSEIVPEVELYDLTFDPEEFDNLAEVSDVRGTRERLTRNLYEWMVGTDDPLLSGAVLPPSGAIVDPPDAWRPS